MDELSQPLIETRSGIQQSFDQTIAQWRGRLNVRVKAKGKHVEHLTSCFVILTFL